MYQHHISIQLRVKNDYAFLKGYPLAGDIPDGNCRGGRKFAAMKLRFNCMLIIYISRYGTPHNETAGPVMTGIPAAAGLNIPGNWSYSGGR